MWSYVRNLPSKARAWITAGLGTFAALAVAVAHLPPGIGAKAEKPMIYLVRDDALMPALQPGLPEKMAYVWLMPATAIPEGRIDFSIEAEKFKQRDNLYGMPGWFNAYTAAKASLALAGGQG